VQYTRAELKEGIQDFGWDIYSEELQGRQNKTNAFLSAGLILGGAGGGLIYRSQSATSTSLGLTVGWSGRW